MVYFISHCLDEIKKELDKLIGTYKNGYEKSAINLCGRIFISFTL